MKTMKSILILFAVLIAFNVGAQNTITLVPDTAGTLIGTAAGLTHKFTSGNIGSGPYVYSIEVYMTASGTHATDSTEVSVWASMDGTNYFQLTTDLGTPHIIGTLPVWRTGVYFVSRLSSAGTGATGCVWKPSYYLQYRYLQVRITQFKVSSILTVNRCKLHLFR